MKRGFCNTHYEWMRRKGLLVIRDSDPERRFWSNVTKTETCWEWAAAIASGYGRVLWRGHVSAAHRVSYELLVGPIPEGLQLDHLCRNRGCVNPSHLEPVTAQVNLLRGVGVSAIKAGRTHCEHGHEFTPENIYLWRGARYCRTCRAGVSQRRATLRLHPERTVETTCVVCGGSFTYVRMGPGGARNRCSEACRVEDGRRAAREYARRKRAAAKNQPR